MRIYRSQRPLILRYKRLYRITLKEAGDIAGRLKQGLRLWALWPRRFFDEIGLWRLMGKR